MVRVAVYVEWFIVSSLYGLHDSEFRLKLIHEKFIEVFPVFTVIFNSLSLKKMTSFFLHLSKELPEEGRNTARPTTGC